MEKEVNNEGQEEKGKDERGNAHQKWYTLNKLRSKRMKDAKTDRMLPLQKQNLTS